MGMTRGRGIHRVTLSRCRWTAGDLLLERYHDREWGRPVRGPRAHFERLTLEAFQAGLSWRIVLHKRPAFRAAFDRFDPARVARYTRRDIERLMKNPGIVRNRLKIRATVENARRFLRITGRHGSFDRYLDAHDEDLLAALRRDFRFMGPLVAEAYLQSVGWIPAPHDRSCFLHGARGQRSGGR